MIRRLWLLPLLAIVMIAGLRIAGPPDLLDKDQPRPIEYVLDAAADGNWIVQRDAGGSPCSKPPVYTWMASVTSLVVGGSRLALYLPCAAAMIGLTMLAYAMARRRLGATAGLASAMAVALSIDAQKAVALARTDAVFAACVGVAAWLALRAWESGRGWLLFWMVCAVVCLAKSPVGVVFAAGGLVAAWCSSRPVHALPQRHPIGVHVVGLAIMVSIAGGWFLLAYLQLGQPLIDRMIGRELVGHAIANDHGKPVWQTFWQPIAWYAGLFAPWSLLCIAAIVRLIRQPPASPRRARFLRYMACWLGVGILLLCLVPHKRMVLALPMLLPGAILAGAEAAHWLRGWSLRRQVIGWSALAALMLVALTVYHLKLRDPHGDTIIESRAVLDACAALAHASDAGSEIAWVAGAPGPVRYFLPGWPRSVPVAEIAGITARPGPSALLVRTGTPAPATLRRVAFGPALEVLYDGGAP